MRAIETLQSVDLIACEDTRHSMKLLQAYDIRKPLQSLHEHNEARRSGALIDILSEGRNVALISDAGTPLISDPGYRLVRAVLDAGLEVESIPGPCAAINALAASGLPTDSFYFIGFLPPKSAARRRRFEALKDFPDTLIFYESPHRIQKFLEEAYEVLGSRPLVLAREMTKKFEECYRGSLLPKVEEYPLRSWKGEFVVLLAGAEGG